MTRTALDALKSRSHGISLGMFAADLGDLRNIAGRARGWGCGILHFDVMDGVFVPAMTGGAGFIKALDGDAVCDVHLMVKHPLEHVGPCVRAGADIITVHAEAEGAAGAIAAIRQAATTAGRPVLAGLGLMPGTTLADAAPLLALEPDMILVLSLDPRGTQPADISAACARINALKTRLGPDGPLLAFDGGVTLDSLAEISACCPDMVVSGSAVLGAEDPEAVFEAMANSLVRRSDVKNSAP